MKFDLSEAIEQFRAAIQDVGLIPPDDIIPDGGFHRFPTKEDPGDDAGYYILFVDDNPGGAYGDFRSGLKGKWRLDIGRTLTPHEREVDRERMRIVECKRKAEKAARRERARDKAAEIWDRATPAAEDHSYLLEKGVAAYGLRQDGGSLVLRVEDGSELHSLQFISSEGDKWFLPGGRVSGCSFLIGEPEGVLCIAEGYATGATIHEATGYAVAVAFNAGNLPPVAKSLSDRHPDLRLIVCADDDLKTRGNPGLTKARIAAEAVEGLLAVPDFRENRLEGASDFNDLFLHVDAEAVAECVERAESVEWPAAKPIIAELKPVPAFDADTLLPDALRPWVMDEAERMPCSVDFVASAAIVALGSIIGARCAIKPKARDSWVVVPNLWGGIVGDPSSKKSPAWSAALRPMDRLIAKAIEANGKSMADYETAKVVFDAEKKAIEDRIKEAARKPSKGDPKVIAMELRSHAEQAPQAPLLRRYKTNDSTVEKLGELLRENPNGLLVLRDELVGLIASWDREGREGTRAFFLEAWNGDQSFDTDRIGRGHISVSNLCLSIFGGTQPDKLTVYLEQAIHSLGNDGMLQRFQVLVYPDSRRWEWRDRAPDKTAKDTAIAAFDALAEFDPVDWGAAPADDIVKFPHFHFDDRAQEIFIEWSLDLHSHRMMAEEEPIIQQHLAKYDKLFPALALILHLADCASTGRKGPVSEEAALRAAAWCEYLEAHARRCYGLLKDDGLRAAQALSTKLEQGKLEDGFTLREVRRNQWRSLTKDEAIQAALDWLEDEDWLRTEVTGGMGPGSGRRTVRYSISPAIKTKPGSES